MCIEVLTQSGTPNSWSPAMCVESIMNTVILNMCALCMTLPFPSALQLLEPRHVCGEHHEHRHPQHVRSSLVSI